ncbi:MAG: family 78 glycoside hydrolase catalytic domain [Bacteroidales bacterium]|nr:family 78 glycoside hydrolase catalytic domain [Bacteroidales bacterium]
MRFTSILAALALILYGCSGNSVSAGTRCEALDDSCWDSSEWISAANAPVITGVVNSKQNRRAADGASWFVSTVENPSQVKSARWMTTGLGIYQLYLNGKPVGEDFLKPGFTHAAKTKISYTYDITDAFNKAAGAENVLSAQVTPGWWADKIVTPNGHDGMVGDKCAFRAVLELTLADGSILLKGTDTTGWAAGIAGPVVHAAIFDGEEYDARIPAGYDTPEKLSTPEVNTEFNGEIVLTAGAEIVLRRDLTLEPVESYVWKDITGAAEGEYGTVVKLREGKGQMALHEGETLVVDFGQNAAAVPCFEFKAAEGTVLTCLPAEILNDGNGATSRGMDGPEGSVHRTNLRAQDDCFILKYTFAGDKGYVSYMPQCTFFGYRFLSITANADVKIRSIRSIPVTSITKEMETGTLATGSELINKLISNTIWGQRSNYLSVPTDCPQRNERLGWMADTQVFAKTGSFFADTDGFFHKWMRDVRDSQGESGGFPGVAPIAQYGSGTEHMMRLGWSDANIIVPWTVWKQFGDKAIIDENWEAMNRFLAHVTQTRYDHKTNILENGDYQWADWLSYEPLESHSHRAQTSKDANGKRHPLPEAVDYWNYLGACYWAIDAAMMRDMAAATGRDVAEYDAIAQQARDYILANFITADGFFRTEILNTMQTPALFALKTGLVEGEAREAMIRRLRQNFADHDGCLQTGFLGTSILMQTLTENGMADIAWDLLFQRKNPSWLYSVDNGATTIWERWNSYTLENGMGPKGMNSFNHYAYGCVCEWIWETAAGIAADTAQPGFKHIIMKPVPDKRLGSIDAVYNSAAGTIKSSWKYNGDVCTWHFTIPEGATASVTLPGQEEPETYGPGSYTLRIE